MVVSRANRTSSRTKTLEKWFVRSYLNYFTNKNYVKSRDEVKPTSA